jgi:hypothetical protein
MGKKSNVNPDHYKTAGRDPQGQAVLQEVERRKFKEGQAKLPRATASRAAPKPTSASAKKRAANAAAKNSA